jgi:hypothetical protein
VDEMKCIKCNTKNSFKERNENQGQCKRCDHQFVFDPAELEFQAEITDDLFEELISEISIDNTLYFTPVQLYYLLEKTLRSNSTQINPTVGHLCWGGLLVFVIIWIANWLNFYLDLVVPIVAILYATFAIIILAQSAISPQANRQIRQGNIRDLKILSVIIPVFGIPLSIGAQSLTGIIGAICLGLIATLLSIAFKRQKSKVFDEFLIDRKDFHAWLNRWILINDFPDKILASPKISTAQVTSKPKRISYDFDRVVVCDSPKIAQLLLKNNFHFENNCAVMAIDRYPQDIFRPVKAMLDQTPDLKVFAFHDCSPQGLKMIRHLRTEKIWFPDLEIPIISAGILPRHIMNDPDKMISQSAESIRLSKQLAPNLRNLLDPAELAWLDAGFYLELESFPPQELIQILQQAINKSYRLAEIEDGDPIVMSSPDFYTVESII